jgi:hypothetical protein
MPVTGLALVWRKFHYLIQEPEAWTSGIKINMVEMISRNSRMTFMVVLPLNMGLDVYLLLKFWIISKLLRIS